MHSVAAHKDSPYTYSHDHSQCSRQNRAPEPVQPASLRLCHLFTQACLKTHVEIRRRLRRLPFIQQCHGGLHRLQLFRTHTAAGQMITLFRCDLAETSGHIRHPFTNLFAFHNCFPSASPVPLHTMSKQILLTVLAKSHKPGRAATLSRTRSSSTHRQSACSPSADTCA